MMRTIIDFIAKFLGIVRKNRKVISPSDPSDGLVKVNLGCGLRVARGWLNIDSSINALVASWPSLFHKIVYRFSGSKLYYSADEYYEILNKHKFIYHDLSLSLPFFENSVDIIYSSHFFEHLFKDDAENLLKLCYGALKPGGIIRISIPDLSYAISLYAIGRKSEMLNDYFFVEGKGSYLARHKYMYDYQMIEEELQKANFSNIKRCEYKQGKVPDINILDVYPDVSLFIEAEKII